jgi:hypothetical protein
MHRKTIAALFAAAFAFSSAARGDEGPPKIVPHVPERVFLPLGFDDNDNAQVVLYGTYPDSCWKVAGSQARVDQAQRKIYVQDRALHYSGWACAEVISHYTKSVDLGPLPPGSYEILVEGDSVGPVKWLPMGTLKIGKTHNPNPDDFLYAPVQETVFSRADNVLILRGDWAQSCLDMASVKVRFFPGLIEVLPVAQMTGGTCEMGWFPFEEKVDLTSAEPGLTLIHVRSLNGQAVNRVEEL